MNWWGRTKPRRSARVVVIEDGRLLVFRRKRYSRKTGEWIEYCSIPGGGIDSGELPEDAAIREMKEEMGVDVRLGPMLAHRVSKRFEHFVYEGKIVGGRPVLQLDSEEARGMHDANQFIVEWVPVVELTPEALRYYRDYLPLIKELARGIRPSTPHYIDAR